jgi:hypothetical protein
VTVAQLIEELKKQPQHLPVAGFWKSVDMATEVSDVRYEGRFVSLELRGPAALP